ncbi:MAG: DUF192 domain-containing protein [Patescibacteria group bacterium]
MSRVLFYWLVAITAVVIIVLLLMIMLVTIPHNQQTQNINTSRLKVGESIINVEIADTPAKQNKGLSGRESLAADSGMLFVYSKPAKIIFWMKDMRFVLDFVWIANGQVIQLDENIPPPPTPTDEPARIYPQDYYDMVLEVSAGWIKNNQIKIGDKVELLP